jgi:pyruvate/2-oxoglutarate dehydrogenase complex dihydrolipoamide acyltransferase (E2) component
LQAIVKEGKMAVINVPAELWSTSLLPEGILEHWLVADGDKVDAGSPIAIVRIEGARRGILAPTSGRIKSTAAENSVIEPGSVLAHLIEH